MGGGEGGLYSVRLHFSRDRIAARISAMEARIAALENRMAGMDDGPVKSALRLQVAALKKQIEYINSHVPNDVTVSAWCADLTEDLSGEVGMVEVPGERDIIQVRSGHEGAGAYDPARDGILEPSTAGTPAGVFYNLALLPGWQKWMPTYRHGTITAIDHEADICDVSLDPAHSSQKNLDVNRFGALSGVPIEYMTCNGQAFDEGDEVLVEFEGQQWDAPKVIGFKREPKPCFIGPYLVMQAGQGPTVSYLVWDIGGNCRANIPGVSFPTLMTPALQAWLDTLTSLPNMPVYSNSALVGVSYSQVPADHEIYNGVEITHDPYCHNPLPTGGQCEVSYTYRSDLWNHSLNTVCKTVANDYYYYDKKENYALDPITQGYFGTWTISNLLHIHVHHPQYRTHWARSLMLDSRCYLIDTDAARGEMAELKAELYEESETEGESAPPGEYVTTAVSLATVDWVTPIGAMDNTSYRHNHCTRTQDGWPGHGGDVFYSGRYNGWHYSLAEMNSEKEPIYRKFEYHRMFERAMVQVWFYQVSLEEYDLGGSHQTGATKNNQTYSREVQVAAAAELFPEGDLATNHDPREQTRNARFETAIVDLIDFVTTEQESVGLIGEDETISGPISAEIMG
jgi:hypothetical protein